MNGNISVSRDGMIFIIMQTGRRKRSSTDGSASGKRTWSRASGQLFTEKEVNNLYNSIACIDADGRILGIYRKTHIPDDHYYQEKFYFTPGDTGFRIFETIYGKIGIGICWDQWFPESARCMALQGAELLFYPTAIGSEPILECDSMPHWRRCMQGHAAANLMPVIAANRIGKSGRAGYGNGGQKSALTFMVLPPER